MSHLARQEDAGFSTLGKYFLALSDSHKLSKRSESVVRASFVRLLGGREHGKYFSKYSANVFELNCAYLHCRFFFSFDHAMLVPLCCPQFGEHQNIDI